MRRSAMTIAATFVLSGVLWGCGGETRTITRRETVETIPAAPVVVEKRTTIESVPPPVVEHERTERTVERRTTIEE